jgi:hypothetical protein
VNIFLTEHDVRGLSVVRLLRVKSRILAKFVIEWSTRPIDRRRKLQAVRELHGRSSERIALVLGLGPSIRKLDAEKIVEQQERGDLDVFAVNAFALSKLAETVVPRYYVLTDPAFFGGDVAHYKSTSRASPTDVWEYIQRHQDTTVVIPHNRSVPAGIEVSRLVYVNALGLQGFTNETSPIKPRGYLAITAYSALGLAGWMGYGRILISGIDNSQFRNMRLSSRGKVAVGASHAYTTDDGRANEIALFSRGGVAAYFEDVSRLFRDLELFRGLPIENLDQDTLVDTFPIAKDCHRFTTSQ